MSKGFWETLVWPVFGLSPMDGVTDAPFRYIASRHGRPAVTFTEFTSVEGIRAGAIRLLDDFLYDPIERPVVAQLFGADPSAFFLGAVVVSALGFDGIDINMGCPSKQVTSHGAGAALIHDPERALAIVNQAKSGTKAWSEGFKLEEAGMPKELINLIYARQEKTPCQRHELPVSIKTRIGYDRPITDEWIPAVAAMNPAVISLHGRTLKQLYTGVADWEAIAQAARISHQEGIRLLGNGDISSLADAREKVARYHVDGALIGRAAQGNPWLFREYSPTARERLEVALEHATRHAATFPAPAFVRMRKHLLDYVRGFEEAKELRRGLMVAQNLSDVETVLLPTLACLSSPAPGLIS